VERSSPAPCIIEGYGLSETSPVATCNRCDSFGFTGTIGLPVPSTEVAILDDDGPVALGSVGEIAIRGPQVMAGYWNRPDETAKVMTPTASSSRATSASWTKRLREDRRPQEGHDPGVGLQRLPERTGRRDRGHPGVLECAVIGVPDEHSGEAVKVFVVRKDPNLTAEQLMDYCKREFTGYKKPKYIEFRDELPKTNVGKILRRALREEKQAA
jgi:long-chain acyl-CoA synthetase